MTNKTARIYLTGRVVRIVEADWPLTFRADLPGLVLRVRRHADGRRLVYGRALRPVPQNGVGALLPADTTTRGEMEATRTAVGDVANQLGAPELLGVLRPHYREEAI
jgi:hypothetical protein